MPCDAWSFCNLFKRKGPTQRLKKVNFRAIMDPSPSSGAQSTAPTGCASTGQLTRPPPTLRIPRPPTRSRLTWMPTFCWTALSMLNILFLTEKNPNFWYQIFSQIFFALQNLGCLERCHVMRVFTQSFQTEGNPLRGSKRTRNQFYSHFGP